MKCNKANFVLSNDIRGKESELCIHYKDVAAKAASYRKSLKQSAHFWNRPVIFSENIFTLSFPWHDHFHEGRPLLKALASGQSGEVFSDIDQGWELDIYLDQQFFYAREGNPDDDEARWLVKFEYQPIRDQVLELVPRVERLIAYLSSELGYDYWT